MGREALSGSARAGSDKGVDAMKDSARYVKVVEWSDVDQCYVGSAPGLIYGGCHGSDEKEGFDDRIVSAGRQASARSHGRSRLREYAAERKLTASSESKVGSMT